MTYSFLVVGAKNLSPEITSEGVSKVEIAHQIITFFVIGSASLCRTLFLNAMKNPDHPDTRCFTIVQHDKREYQFDTIN